MPSPPPDAIPLGARSTRSWNDTEHYGRFSARDRWTTVRRPPLGRQPAERCPLAGAKRRGRTGSRRDLNPLTEPISVASGSGDAVLTECSIGPVAVAPSFGSPALRLVLSLCAKERAAVAAGKAPEGVPGAIGIRIPRCSARAHRADLRRVGVGCRRAHRVLHRTCRRCSIACATRLRVALLGCATGRSDVVAGDAPEGVSDV
jgi:hypothetical protein